MRFHMSGDKDELTDISRLFGTNSTPDLKTVDQEALMLDIPELVPSPPTHHTYQGKTLYLEMEGGQEVFYKGAYVSAIPLMGNPLIIGRRDILSGFYPDIDLAMYWKQDRAISRKHVKVFCDVNGTWFVEDLCNHNATFLNAYKYPLNNERVELQPNDRILISMSLAMVFKVSDERG